MTGFEIFVLVSIVLLTAGVFTALSKAYDTKLKEQVDDIDFGVYEEINKLKQQIGQIKNLQSRIDKIEANNCNAWESEVAGIQSRIAGIENRMRIKEDNQTFMGKKILALEEYFNIQAVFGNEVNYLKRIGTTNTCLCASSEPKAKRK